jgi:protoporphyrinogen oxidase
MKKNSVLIIGAGPAGLTAGYELLKQGYDVTILEQEDQVGGISKTINHNGNHIDIGGHRFFSKIKRVNSWWDEVLGEDFLIRNRKSRILYERNFYDYPIALNKTTIQNLGLIRFFKIGFSYLKSVIFKKDEKTLEDFFINRFGYELYATFFKDYTHKVWGVPCDKIDALFGHQRVKGLSIRSVLWHMIKKSFGFLDKNSTETSLIEQFSYPKYGPGQLWEDVAKKIINNGGKILFNESVNKIDMIDNQIVSVKSDKNIYKADFIISSMAVKNLFESFQNIPSDINNIALNLEYRDFITVGLLVDKLQINELDDNWIYIQESDVNVGRLQIFNNWSEYLVKDKNKIWIGMEYFCNENDELWSMDQDSFIDMASSEMQKLGFIKNRSDIVDKVQIKIKKAYPSYFGTYKDFHKVQKYLSSIDNLYCVGRNGQHRYNNMDHSMMTSFNAVDSIVNKTSKDKIWSVNTEKEYHEQKS